MFEGTQVQIMDMADRREARVHEQQYLIDTYHKPVISFCMNIPGPVKTAPEITEVFADGVDEIHKTLAAHSFAVLEEHSIDEITGNEQILCVDADAETIKDLMCKIEEIHPLGRLFDIDVIGVDGMKLSRASYRKCLLCDKQAQDCARARTHTIKEMQDKIEELILSYLGEKE